MVFLRPASDGLGEAGTEVCGAAGGGDCRAVAAAFALGTIKERRIPPAHGHARRRRARIARARSRNRPAANACSSSRRSAIRLRRGGRGQEYLHQFDAAWPARRDDVHPRLHREPCPTATASWFSSMAGATRARRDRRNIASWSSSATPCASRRTRRAASRQTPKSMPTWDLVQDRQQFRQGGDPLAHRLAAGGAAIWPCWRFR